jgi:hypothetical protein
MKISVCYSGMFRNFQNNVDNHIEHLISKYDCDVYLSFWDTHGFGSFRDKHNIKHDDIIPEHVKVEILNKLHPKNFEFEPFSQLEHFFEFEGKKYRDSEHPPFCKNILSMYYKINRCGEMVKDSNVDYDLILRLRSDILFSEDLILQLPKENTIYSPIKSSWNQSMNDQIIYGNKEVMGIYYNLYNKLPEIWMGWVSHATPEALLYRHMENNNISMESQDINYDLLDKNNNKR